MNDRSLSGLPRSRRAGMAMLHEIRSFAERRVSFAFEPTLSGRSYLTFLRKLKAEGYDIHFFFLWLKSVDLALSRVKERVSRGGHDVPEPVIRRRFDRSMENFLLHLSAPGRGLDAVARRRH